MEAAIAVCPASGSGQDRAIAVPTGDGWLVALADGAGGIGGGTVAAESLIAFVRELAPNAASTDWCAALATFDGELSAHRSGGQTTGVVAFVDADGIIGASVGDSSAWLLRNGRMTDLTARQHRKQLLGSGSAMQVRFHVAHKGGRLLLASDGLTTYVTADRICTLAEGESIEAAVDALTNAARLPSGALQDDVAVVLVSRQLPAKVARESRLK